VEDAGDFLMRRGAAAAGLAALLVAAASPAGATPAFAEEPRLAGRDASPGAPRATGSELERWRGRFCTPAGCAGGREAPAPMAAGFAAAALLAVLAARRRPPGRG
jgi:hypothetical protein